MAKFDFGHADGKRFQKNSWVADENAWNISQTPASTPNIQPLPISQPQTTWDKVKKFDFSGLGITPKQILSDFINVGLPHGLSQTGTAKQDRGMADILSKNTLPFMADIGKKQLADQQIQKDYLDSHPVNSIGGMIGEQIPQIPLWMAGELGVNAVGKGLTKAFPSLLPIAEKAGAKLPGIIQGGLKDAATYGTVVAPVDSIKNGDNLSQFLDREKQLPGVLLGGVAFRGAGKAIGKGIEGAKNALKPNEVQLPSIDNMSGRTPSTLPQGPIQTPSITPQVEPTMNGRFQVKPDQRMLGTEIPNEGTPSIIPERINPIQEAMQPTITTPQHGNSSIDFPFPTKDIPIVRYQKEVGAATHSDTRGGTWYNRVNNIHGENTGYNTADKTVGGMNQLKENYTPQNPLLVNDTTSPGAGQAAIQAIKGEKYLDDIYNAWGEGNSATKVILKEVGLSDAQATELLAHPDQPQVIFDRIGTELAKKAGYDSIIHTTPNGIYAEVVKLKSESPAPPQPNIGEPKIVNERSFAQNVRDSQVAPEGVKQNTLDNQLTYEPITNKETLDKANMEVATDAVKARQKFNAPSKGISADDVALGESLIVKAIKDGDTVGANELIADLAEKLTQAGQAVQAAKIFKRLTPEGMLLYANKVVTTVNKNLIERLGKKAPKVELTPEDSKFIIETMQRAGKLPEGREKDIAMAQVKSLIANKMPASLTDKIKGLQRISLLLNPKTMTRNILGNTVFGAIDNLSNVVATPIDKAIGLLSKKRTTTLPSLKGQLKSMGEGVKLTAQDAKLGVDTYNTKTQYEFSGNKTFNNPLLHKLDRATIVGLKMGDTPFHKAAFDDSIRQQMKLAKVDKPTLAMEEQAQKTADQRTYQDVNKLTEGFKVLQGGLNKFTSTLHIGNDELGLGNVVMPFVKTPANILKRALEYSPAGITDALAEATKIRKGKFDQKVFVDSLSRSITGSALIMVGYDLAKRGIITGSANKDKDIASFERGLGKNDYAFKYGDNLYTYDWMQPGSMALAIGADVYIKGKDRKQAENVVIDAIKSGGETLYKQSLLQGITRFMSGYNPMDNLATTAINAPNQFIPTLAKQLSQVGDPTQRTTTNPTNLGTEGNLLKSRIPGLTKTLEPKVNTSGETMQNFQGKNNLFNIFVNPGSSTTYKPNDIQKEILRVYDATGNKDVFPRLAPTSLTEKGQSIKLTPQEITTFQQKLGKDTMSRMQNVIDYKEIKTLSQQERDDRRAKDMAAAIQKAYDDAKMELLKNRGIK